MSTDLDFDRLVYFGDSLTDSGNLFEATSAVAFFGLPPEAAGYAQQFSNGNVYADLTPELLGVDSVNYAVGDAQVLNDRTVGAFLDGTGLIRPDATAEDLGFRIDYVAQVERFLQAEAGGDLSDTAVSIFAGANDFRDFVPTSLNVVQDVIAYGTSVATVLLESAATLTFSGVGTVIINTASDSDFFPRFEEFDPTVQALSSLYSSAINATIYAGAEQLNAAGANVVIVELGAMSDEVNGDFESFGFRVFDEPLIKGSLGSDGLNPNLLGVPVEQIGFFDSVHPTAELHEIWGVFQAESLTSEVVVGDGTSEGIKGTKSDDLILARGGDDAIKLGNGDDIAIAGLGDDTVDGGNGADLIAGGAGHDMLKGGNASDIITDGTGDDISKGGNGNDLLIDSAGADMAYGGNGSDVFIFTDDAIFGRETEDMNFFDGGRGHDTLILRVADPVADLAFTQDGKTTFYTDLGLSTVGIEEVFVVAYNDLPEIDGFEDAFQTADYWHFV